MASCSPNCGRHFFETRLQAFETQVQVDCKANRTFPRRFATLFRPYPCKFWMFIFMNVNFEIESRVLTSKIIKDARPAVIPTHISSLCMLVKSTVPSGRIPFTAPPLPFAYFITLNSNIVSKQLWIFSFSNTWNWIILLEIKPISKKEEYMFYFVVQAWASQEPVTTTHVRHDAVMVAAVAAVIFVVFAVPKLFIVRLLCLF